MKRYELVSRPVGQGDHGYWIRDSATGTTLNVAPLTLEDAQQKCTLANKDQAEHDLWIRKMREADGR